jgi:hypothetical protein
MDHVDVVGQQTLNAITENGVGVATAKLHQAVNPVRPGLTKDVSSQFPGKLAIMELVDVFHFGEA